MASFPSTDLAGVPVELLEQAARQQMTNTAAELEAYRMAVAEVRQLCHMFTGMRGGRAALAALVLHLLSDLPCAGR